MSATPERDALELAKEETRNSVALASFTSYCLSNPSQRFWQALRNWSPWEFILAANTRNGATLDTFGIDADVQQVQESIGPGANFLRFRSGPRKNERMSLAELPVGRGNMADEPSFSCSFFCEMAEDDLSLASLKEGE